MPNFPYLCWDHPQFSVVSDSFACWSRLDFGRLNWAWILLCGTFQLKTLVFWDIVTFLNWIILLTQTLISRCCYVDIFNGCTLWLVLILSQSSKSSLALDIKMVKNLAVICDSWGHRILAFMLSISALNCVLLFFSYSISWSRSWQFCPWVDVLPDNDEFLLSKTLSFTN